MAKGRLLQGRGALSNDSGLGRLSGAGEKEVAEFAGQRIGKPGRSDRVGPYLKDLKSPLEDRILLGMKSLAGKVKRWPGKHPIAAGTGIAAGGAASTLGLAATLSGGGGGAAAQPVAVDSRSQDAGDGNVVSIGDHGINAGQLAMGGMVGAPLAYLLYKMLKRKKREKEAASEKTAILPFYVVLRRT